MGEERFRRALRGYDPNQVKEALLVRDERVARLEAEAAKLAKRVTEQERRLREMLDGSEGGLGSASPGAIGALSRRLEEIHAQARGQATRMRMKALQDAVRMSDRVTELAKLRDELSTRVQELAGMAGIKLDPEETGEKERPLRGTEPSRRGPSGEGIYLGEVDVEVGPLADFSQLTSFEDALGDVQGASGITIRSFAAGRATLRLTLTEPLELVAALRERAPFAFAVRSAHQGGIVLDVDASQGRQAA